MFESAKELKGYPRRVSKTGGSGRGQRGASENHYQPGIQGIQRVVDSDSVQCHITDVDERFSIGELVDAVNGWCDEHGVVPVSNQAGERLTERNVRFYRTIGLVDAPESGGGQGYSEKHKLQLMAVRLLQGQGLPLRRIRDLLLGRSISDLRLIEKQGLAEHKREAQPTTFRPMPGEDWRMTPLDSEFLLVSRQNRPLPEGVLDELRAVLRGRTAREKD
jgi:DNA-binding transcriptional MerR regulator